MNKLKITAYMFLLWTAFHISGCAGRNQMYLEAKTQDAFAETESESVSKDTAAGNAASASLGADSDEGLYTNPKDGTDNENGLEHNLDKDLDENPAGKTCFVYVCGAVNQPGVFELPAGSRVYEAIALAGGLRKDASDRGINQAQQVADGDMIEVLTIAEQQEAAKEAENTAAKEAGAGDGRIDINTASAAELMTLNGIGQAKAANIIAYRESHGKFSAVEELMNVSGIGEGVYAKVQDKITVEK